jgi:hypothetical protein
MTSIEKGFCSHNRLIRCFGAGKDCEKLNKEVNAMLERSTIPAIGNASLSSLQTTEVLGMP